ncbi:uncharacterized protein LOC130943941 isoform X3 [Arachis stenosperma]|uniref:uncharacterized protein LOC130943941 isoform X3 n=1 Tax=Arachis stenosperma TaxID=217475 RepID=UPI0025AD4209|nr:uncharacterized protein LOC130943941 isoform X3 [Arachis stenosperma]
MMAAAAAEVRAAWQRTANRCFVQEDAKRAPKLACCQPCCAASKPVDAGAANAADESNHAAVSATSFNNKSSLSSLTPDSRWWLHPQPSYGSRKESDISWIEVGKSWPWWRTSDRDELASFVSQKSVNHIENCDLPPPQKYLSGQPCGSADSTARSKGSLPALSCDTRHVYLASNKSSSIYSSIHEDVMDQVLEGNHSKTELIEALCRSQTRARMAEEAAKQAYAEKEHIITLFFKQASQLFAYKQWFQLLLVENLHIQLKNNKDRQISGLFQAPASFERGAKPWKTRHKPKGDITTTYAVAFALGLSLVGAGLILGWSVGWMLPRL